MEFKIKSTGNENEQEISILLLTDIQYFANRSFYEGLWKFVMDP